MMEKLPNIIYILDLEIIASALKPDVSFHIFSWLDFLKTYIITAPDATLHVCGVEDLEICI